MQKLPSAAAAAGGGCEELPAAPQAVCEQSNQSNQSNQTHRADSRLQLKINDKKNNRLKVAFTAISSLFTGLDSNQSVCNAVTYYSYEVFVLYLHSSVDFLLITELKFYFKSN